MVVIVRQILISNGVVLKILVMQAIVEKMMAMMIIKTMILSMLVMLMLLIVVLAGPCHLRCSQACNQQRHPTTTPITPLVLLRYQASPAKSTFLPPPLQIDANAILIGSFARINGLNFAGSPYTPQFCGVWQVRIGSCGSTLPVALGLE